MLFNSVDRLKNQKGLQVFTFKQLHSVTVGFGESNVVGHGRIGWFGRLPLGVFINLCQTAMVSACAKVGDFAFKLFDKMPHKDPIA